MDSAPRSSSPHLDMDNIKALKVVGKGAMGTVFLAHDRSADPSARSLFAVKVVDKNSFHAKLDAERRASWEIRVLTRLSDPKTLHPFLQSLLGSFESDSFLCWAVPYCPGGDLNALRYRQTDRVYPPAVIKFYLAEIVCALEHLHNMGTAYRDLKPENVLIQQFGHVTLTDFDLSRNLKAPQRNKSVILEERLPEIHRKHRRNPTRWITGVSDGKNRLKKVNSARVSPVSRRKQSFVNGERSNSFVGTEEYISPEVIRGDGHEFAVDWWALGILTYEMLYGKTPFKGKNRKETFGNVLVKAPEFVGKRTDLTDLIERLLEKDPTRRLGYLRGACEIKEHVFFKGVKWDQLTEVSRPPFIPLVDEKDLTEQLTACGGDIREYFKRLRSPPSIPNPPLKSPHRHSECKSESMDLSKF